MKTPRLTIARADPTRTTMLRKRFQTDMSRRVASVIRSIRQKVVDEDAFGLEQEKHLILFNAERQVWRFETDAGKVEAFRGWLQNQVDQKILTVDSKGAPWTNEYVGSAYRQGIVSSFVEKNKELLTGSTPFTEGTKAQFLTDTFNAPETKRKLELLYGRTFNNLKGFTDAMAQQTSNIVTQGIANGKNPKVIARELAKGVEGLSKKRALVIARTEVIHAHAEGQLDSYEKQGQQNVSALAEWHTAGDMRVCPLCAPLEGVVLTIKEARGMIPRHPSCRCAWLPADVGEKSDQKQKMTKAAIEQAVTESIQAEAPKKPAEAAKENSPWIGKEKTFGDKEKTPILPPRKPVVRKPRAPKPQTPPTVVKPPATGTTVPTPVAQTPKVVTIDINPMTLTTLEQVDAAKAQVVGAYVGNQITKERYRELIAMLDQRTTELKNASKVPAIPPTVVKKSVTETKIWGSTPSEPKATPESKVVKESGGDKVEQLRKELEAQKARTEQKRLELEAILAKKAATEREAERQKAFEAARLKKEQDGAAAANIKLNLPMAEKRKIAADLKKPSEAATFLKDYFGIDMTYERTGGAELKYSTAFYQEKNTTQAILSSFMDVVGRSNMPPPTEIGFSSIHVRLDSDLADPKVNTQGAGLFFPNTKKIAIGGTQTKYQLAELKKLSREEYGVDPSVRGILRHEIGHAYHAEILKDVDTRRSWWEATKASKGFYPSDYSAANEDEFFAENFAAYTHPRYKPGMLPKAIEEFFDTHVGLLE